MTTSWKQHLKAFYHDHKSQLYGYARSIVHNDMEAEDLVHSSLERIIEYIIENGHLPEDLRIFSIRCIKNAAIDYLRKKKCRNEIHFDIQQVIDPSCLDPEQIMVADHLCCLDEDEKELILLRNFLGYTFREIAKIKEVPVNTMASWHRRAIQKMRVAIEEEDESNE